MFDMAVPFYLYSAIFLNVIQTSTHRKFTIHYYEFYIRKWYVSPVHWVTGHDGCYMWSKSCVPFRSTWVHPGMWLRTYCSSLFFCVYFSFLLSHVSIGVFFNHVLFSSVIPNCFNVYKLLSFFFFLLFKRYELSQSSKIPYDWVIVPYTKWAIFQEDEVDVYQCLLTETGNW